jgi:hypothetical protein
VHQTGVLGGGALSVNADTTKFDVAAGNGVILDYANPNNPVKTEISWDSSAAITVTGIAANGTTAVFVDNTGAITQSSAAGAADYRNKVFLGLLVHADRVNIDEVVNEPSLGYDGVSDFRYKTLAISHDSGIHYSAYSTNLQIERTSGTLYREGLTFQATPELPSLQAASAESPSTFALWYVGSSSSLAEASAATSSIDPDQYNNASTGSLVSVPTDKWTIQRLYASGYDGTFVMYGQEVFDTEADALAAVGSEDFVEPAHLLQTGVYRYALIVQEGTTDLTNATFKEITDTGGLGGGGGGGGVTVHNDLTSIQGGTATERYHFDASDYGDLSSFNSATSKGTPVNADILLIEDSAASLAKKKITVGSLPTGLTQMPVYFLIEQKSSGTNAGSSTASTWVTRSLDVVKINNIFGSSKSGNTFTLPSGQYIIRAEAPGNAVDRHKLRVYDTTHTSVLQGGIPAMCGYVWEETQTLATVVAYDNISSNTTYRIDHWCARTVASYGLGKATSDGSPEEYTQVVIWRVGDYEAS